jgi:hypothetical protein
MGYALVRVTLVPLQVEIAKIGSGKMLDALYDDISWPSLVVLCPPKDASTSIPSPSAIAAVGTMLRRRRSCRKRQLRLKLLVRNAEGTIHEASVLQHIRR